MKEVIEKFFNSRKKLKGLKPSEKQIEEMCDLEKRTGIFTSKRPQTRTNAMNLVYDFIMNDVDTFYYRRYRKIVAYGRNTANRRRSLYRFGPNGASLHDAYKARQGETNTFEYKKSKHGMTEEEFKAYNKSRSVTLENMIERHGLEEGTKRFESYCKRQGYTNTLEYFIERDGVEKGTEAFNEACRQKSHSYDVYLERYGDHETAVSKLIEMAPYLTSSNASVFANTFISDMVNALGIDKSDYYSNENGGEKAIFCNRDKRVNAVDFYHIPTAKVVEVYGDYYHGSPRLYNADSPWDKNGFFNTIGDKWVDDFNRTNSIIEEGHPVLILWEYDIKNNFDAVIHRVKEFLWN